MSTINYQRYIFFVGNLVEMRTACGRGSPTKTCHVANENACTVTECVWSMAERVFASRRSPSLVWHLPPIRALVGSRHDTVMPTGHTRAKYVKNGAETASDGKPHGKREQEKGWFLTVVRPILSCLDRDFICRSFCPVVETIGARAGAVQRHPRRAQPPHHRRKIAPGTSTYCTTFQSHSLLIVLFCFCQIETDN